MEIREKLAQVCSSPSYLVGIAMKVNQRWHLWVLCCKIHRRHLSSSSSSSSPECSSGGVRVRQEEVGGRQHDQPPACLRGVCYHLPVVSCVGLISPRHREPERRLAATILLQPTCCERLEHLHEAPPLHPLNAHTHQHTEATAHSTQVRRIAQIHAGPLQGRKSLQDRKRSKTDRGALKHDGSLRTVEQNQDCCIWQHQHSSNGLDAADCCVHCS